MNTWDLFSEGNEKPTAHEKFKRGVKSAGYDMDAGAKRLEDLLAKQKAERDAREKDEQKNVNEAQREVDYDDDYQDMVRRVRDKAKAADALKAQGKEPQTKFNPKTGKYYVDFGQDKPVKENAEELNIGDPVIITGNVEFEGKTGDIIAFGQDKRFVVVNLYNHGKHSFHSSDVSFNDYADSDEEESRMHEAGYGRNRGYTPGFASPNAPSLGGRGHREDDEGWGQEQQALTTTWYIRVNGKIIKDKMGVPYQYRGKETAAKAARSMMSKPYNAGKKFVLTTKAQDDQPENEAILHTNYKHNRFKAVTQRDQAQDKAASMAMNRVRGMAEGMPLGKVLSFPNLVGQVKHILDAKHGDIGWKMSKRDDDVFLFSAMNDYNVRSMLVVAKVKDGWVSATNGMVDPHGEVEMYDEQELPMTLASASEIADEAISTYHDIDLSDYADEDEQGVAEGSFDHWSPMGKDSIHQDRIRSLQNLIAIAKEQDRPMRVQELELALKKLQGVAEGKKPDNYHIVNKDGKPASLASYADKASAVKDRDAKHPDAEVRQVGPRGKVKSVSEGSEHYDGIEISMEKEDDEIMVKAMMSGGRELGHVLFVIDVEYLAPQDL